MANDERPTKDEGNGNPSSLVGRSSFPHVPLELREELVEVRREVGVGRQQLAAVRGSPGA